MDIKRIIKRVLNKPEESYAEIVPTDEAPENNVPVENSRRVLKLMVDMMTNDYRSGRKTLASDLRKELKKAFGPATGNFKSEFDYSIWYLKYKDLVFSVYSASGKGTAIEAGNLSYNDVRDDKRFDDIAGFLHVLSDKVNEV